MKLWTMAVMMAGAMTAMAQKPAIDEVYLTVDEVPNAVYWLPVPPEPGSTQFVHDINQYYWGMALLLSEINPEAQDELFKLGYEWGQSRVIAGFHWQSDVDASRMLAAATYARLHACDAFNEDMEKAKKEFKKLKAQR